MTLSRSSIFYILLGLLAGLGLGLLYSWQISPVTYVDASPSILRADFKDQYRIVIAAAYASTHDLPRARARLELLKDPDPVGELSAQAQRMLAGGESNQSVQYLAQLAADLQQGFANLALPSVTSTKITFVGTPFTAVTSASDLGTPSAEAELEEEATLIPEPPNAPVVGTLPFEQTRSHRRLYPRQRHVPRSRPPLASTHRSPSSVRILSVTPILSRVCFNSV